MKRKAQKGVILITCLWVCVLLVWLGLGVSVVYRYRFQDKGGSFIRTKGFYAAIGGIYEMIGRMKDGNLEGGSPGQLDASWKPDGQLYRIAYEGCTVYVTAEDERKKVNINKVSSEELTKILKEHTPVDKYTPIKASQLAERILDFIDEDDFVRNEGAEKEYYETSGLPYKPYNKVLDSLEPILLVPGMNWDIFWGDPADRKISFFPAPHSMFSLFTVYGNRTGQVLENEEGKGYERWAPGGLYRIVSGADCGARKVVVYAIVTFKPGQSPYYSVEFFKEIL